MVLISASCLRAFRLRGLKLIGSKIIHRKPSLFGLIIGTHFDDRYSTNVSFTLFFRRILLFSRSRRENSCVFLTHQSNSTGARVKIFAKRLSIRIGNETLATTPISQQTQETTQHSSRRGERKKGRKHENRARKHQVLL